MATRKKTRVSAVDIGKFDKKALAHFALLAHLDEKELKKAMAALTSISTGKRWCVNYYMPVKGILTRRRCYGRVNTEKDPKIRMQLLLELQTDVFNALIQKQDPGEKTLSKSISITHFADRLISDKKNTSKKTVSKQLRITWASLKNGSCSMSCIKNILRN